MTLQERLAQEFRKNDWKWKIKGSDPVVPTEEDILAALDTAATMLYTESVGTELEIGRLIIKKLHTGHDVYIYSGYFE